MTTVKTMIYFLLAGTKMLAFRQNKTKSKRIKENFIARFEAKLNAVRRPFIFNRYKKHTQREVQRGLRTHPVVPLSFFQRGHTADLAC